MATVASVAISDPAKIALQRWLVSQCTWQCTQSCWSGVGSGPPAVDMKVQGPGFEFNSLKKGYWA